jgi:hypothetical protein
MALTMMTAACISKPIPKHRRTFPGSEIVLSMFKVKLGALFSPSYFQKSYVSGPSRFRGGKRYSNLERMERDGRLTISYFLFVLASRDKTASFKDMTGPNNLPSVGLEVEYCVSVQAESYTISVVFDSPVCLTTRLPFHIPRTFFEVEDKISFLSSSGSSRAL